jgi:hypothetical protein
MNTEVDWSKVVKIQKCVQHQKMEETKRDFLLQIMGG